MKYTYIISVLSYATAYPNTCDSITLSTTPSSFVAPYYASWNIDSSRNRAFFDTNFSDPALVRLAGAVGNTNIRFGGTGNDWLNYAVGGLRCPKPSEKSECLNETWAANLFALAKASSSGLVFGLSITPADSGPTPPTAPWNGTQAKALLSWALEAGYAPFALELGNERDTPTPDSLTGAQQAAAFGVLSGILDEVYASDPASRPLLVGPDPHGFHNATDDAFNERHFSYLQDFLKAAAAAGTKISAITHHEYIEVDYSNVLEPDYLDNTFSLGVQIVAAVHNVSPGMPVWAGEIGPHNGQGTTSANSRCSDNKVCGRFGSTIWYADAMASKAKAGYAAFCRQ